mmetsp:Transcript_41552/g.50380  ORF Transcript_41552/g.50380 Transcript_41552/m.50380 type:complete len:148 (-) Transcript_41552:221-664(-)|eukprot:CAMPEP_0197846854 /NCGR_PEP_ID=MMETSP1438-20131217/4643_1 /TAXON_ID=1461541 /ORGANISM="Pterosperma sp., Strain CCMP1384" /LENGTH=147 /DNA_ID=CAMNT_0043458629 /DNA_START=135 /DNA_END=578 /DNA_ORIENTATION=+
MATSRSLFDTWAYFLEEDAENFRDEESLDANEFASSSYDNNSMQDHRTTNLVLEKLRTYAQQCVSAVKKAQSHTNTNTTDQESGSCSTGVELEGDVLWDIVIANSNQFDKRNFPSVREDAHLCRTSSGADVLGRQFSRESCLLSQAV